MTIVATKSTSPSAAMASASKKKNTKLRIPQKDLLSPLSVLENISSAAASTDRLLLNIASTKKSSTEVTRGHLTGILSIDSSTDSVSSLSLSAADTERTRLEMPSAIPDPLEPQKYNPPTETEKDDQSNVSLPSELSQNKHKSFKRQSLGSESQTGDRTRRESTPQISSSRTKASPDSIEYEEFYAIIADMNPFNTQLPGEDDEMRATIFPPSPKRNAPKTSVEEQEGTNPFRKGPVNQRVSDYGHDDQPQRYPVESNIGLQHHNGQGRNPATPLNDRSAQASSELRASDMQASHRRSLSKNVSFGPMPSKQINTQPKGPSGINHPAEPRSNTVGSSNQGYYTYKMTQKSSGSPVRRNAADTQRMHMAQASGPRYTSRGYSAYINRDQASAGGDFSPTHSSGGNELNHSSSRRAVHSSASRASAGTIGGPSAYYFVPEDILTEGRGLGLMLDDSPRGQSQLMRSKSVPQNMHNVLRGTTTAKKDLSEPKSAFEDDSDENSLIRRDSSPVKRSRSPTKQMFGERGWLSRGNSMSQVSAQRPKLQAIRNLASKVMHIADDKKAELAKRVAINGGDPDAPSPRKDGVRPTTATRFPISIDYADQMCLFGEIELMLTTVINDFLVEEMHAGLMDINNLTRITKQWAQKGRPQVLDFHFDLATQAELLKVHADVFRFHGEGGNDGMRQAVMFNCLRGLVRELSIRTFCAPDSVIKKIMHDSWRVIEMMGAKIDVFMLLQRLQGVTLQKMKEAAKKRVEAENAVFGIPRPFVPPSMANAEDMENAEDDPNDGIYRG